MSKIFQRPLIWLGLFTLVLSACGQPVEPTPEPTEPAVAEELSALNLVGTSWELESMGAPGDEIFVIEGTQPTLNFLVERYAASGGCNWFLGVYLAEGDELRLDMPAATDLWCEQPAGVMDQEGTFRTALINVTGYQLEGDNLVAYTTGNQRLLTLRPAQPVPFETTTWALKFSNDGSDWVPLVIGTDITAQFEGDQLSGSAGCNSYSAAFEREGESLTISDLTITEMSCSEPDGMMSQEQIYLAALQSVASYTSLAGAIALRNAEGQPVLLFGVQTTDVP